MYIYVHVYDKIIGKELEGSICFSERNMKV